MVPRKLHQCSSNETGNRTLYIRRWKVSVANQSYLSVIAIHLQNIRRQLVGYCEKMELKIVVR